MAEATHDVSDIGLARNRSKSNPRDSNTSVITYRFRPPFGALSASDRMSTKMPAFDGRTGQRQYGSSHEGEAVSHRLTEPLAQIPRRSARRFSDQVCGSVSGRRRRSEVFSRLLR